jgi:hypothetical protein
LVFRKNHQTVPATSHYQRFQEGKLLNLAALLDEHHFLNIKHRHYHGKLHRQLSILAPSQSPYQNELNCQ